MTRHILLIIASLLVSGELSYCADPDYIRLDLSPLRGRDVPSNTKAYPRRIPAEPPATWVAIFCTDSTYPNDIFCDVRTYSTGIHKVVIKYPHPDRSDVDCEVHFVKEQAEEYPIVRLPYSRFSCSPSFNDTQVPAFQLTEASYFIIEHDEIHHFDTHPFENKGRVTKSTHKGRRVTVIKFEEQVGSPVAAVIGRPPPPPAIKCENDGVRTRCRPVNQ